MAQRTIVTTHRGETFTLNFDLNRQPTRSEILAAAEAQWKKKYMGMSAVKPIVDIVAPKPTSAPSRAAGDSSRVNELLAKGSAYGPVSGIVSKMRENTPVRDYKGEEERKAIENAVRQLDKTVPEWRNSRRAKDIWRNLYTQQQGRGHIDIDGTIKDIVSGDYESIVAPVARRKTSKFPEHDVSTDFKFPFSMEDLVAKVIDNKFEMRYNSGSLAKLDDVDKMVQGKLGISAEDFAKRWIKDLYDKGEKQKAIEIANKADAEKARTWFGKYVADPVNAVQDAMWKVLGAPSNFIAGQIAEGKKAQVLHTLIEQGLDPDEIKAALAEPGVQRALSTSDILARVGTTAAEFATMGLATTGAAKLLGRIPGRTGLAASNAAAKVGRYIPDPYTPSIAASTISAGVQGLAGATGDPEAQKRFEEYVAARDPRTLAGAAVLGMDILGTSQIPRAFRTSRALSEDILRANKLRGSTRLNEIVSAAEAKLPIAETPVNTPGRPAQPTEPPTPTPTTPKGVSLGTDDLIRIEDYLLSGKGVRLSVAAKALGIEEVEIANVAKILQDAGHLEKTSGGYYRATERGTKGSTAGTTVPEPEAVSTTAPSTTPAPDEAITLPKELADAKPRYGYKDANFTLKFDSDLDKVAYILANDAERGASRSAEKYREFLEERGLDLDDVIEHGKAVRDAVKKQAYEGWVEKSKGETAGVQTLNELAVPDQGFFTVKEDLSTVEKLRAAASAAEQKAAELRSKSGLPQPKGKGRKGGTIDWGKEIEAAVLLGKAKLLNMAADVGDILAVKKEQWMQAMIAEHGDDVTPFLGKIWRRVSRALGLPTKWGKPLEGEPGTLQQIAAAPDTTGARASITKREAFIQRIVQGKKPAGTSLDDMVQEANAWKRAVVREAEERGESGSVVWDEYVDALISTQRVSPRALAGHELAVLTSRQAEVKQQLAELDQRIANARGDKDAVNELLAQRREANDRFENVYRAIIASRAPASDALRAFQLAGGIENGEFRRNRIKTKLVEAARRPLTDAESSEIDNILNQMDKELNRATRVKQSMLSRAIEVLRGEKDAPGSIVIQRREQLLEELRDNMSVLHGGIPIASMSTAVRYLMNEMRGGGTFRDAIERTQAALAAVGVHADAEDLMTAISVAGKKLETDADVIAAIAQTRDELAAMLRSFDVLAGEGAARTATIKLPATITQVMSEEQYNKRIDEIVEQIGKLTDDAPQVKERTVRDYGSEEANNKVRALEDEARMLRHYWSLRRQLVKLTDEGHVPQSIADDIKDYDTLRIAVNKGQAIKSARADIDAYEEMARQGLRLQPKESPSRTTRLDLLLEESLRRRAELQRRLSAKTIGMQISSIPEEKNKIKAVGRGVGLMAKSAWDLSRTLVASLDQSGILTQGGRVAFNPLFSIPWAKSIVPGVRSIVSDKQANRAMHKMETSDLWRVGKMHGLHLVDIASPTSLHEDVFAQDVLNYLRATLSYDKNPISGAVGHLFVSPLIASDRSLGAFTSTVRYNLFKQFTDLQGGWDKMSPEQLKLSADWINSLTSRASTDFGKKSAEFFSKFYFSGHHFTSSFEANLFNPLAAANPFNTRAAGMSPVTRLGVAVTPLVGIGWLTGIDQIMRATGRGFVEWDPSSGDFLKAVIFPDSYDPTKPASKENDPGVTDDATVVDFFRDVTQWARLGYEPTADALRWAARKEPVDRYSTAKNTRTRRSIGTMNVDGSQANAVSYVDVAKLREMPGYKEWINGWREMYGMEPVEDGKFLARPPEFGDIPYEEWKRDTSGFNHPTREGELLKRAAVYKLNPPMSQISNLFLGDFRGKKAIHLEDLLVPITMQDMEEGKSARKLMDKLGAESEEDALLAHNIVTSLANAIGMSVRADRQEDIKYIVEDLKDPESGLIQSRAWFPKVLKDFIKEVNDKRRSEGKAPKSKKELVLGAPLRDILGSKKK